MSKRSPQPTRASAEAVSKAHKAPPDDSPCAHKEGSLFEFGQSPLGALKQPPSIANTNRILFASASTTTGLTATASPDPSDNIGADLRDDVLKMVNHYGIDATNIPFLAAAATNGHYDDESLDDDGMETQSVRQDSTLVHQEVKATKKHLIHGALMHNDLMTFLAMSMMDMVNSSDRLKGSLGSKSAAHYSSGVFCHYCLIPK